MSCQIYALGRAGKALKLSLAAIDFQPDVLFLSVPDDVIVSVAQELSQQSRLPKIVAHLSGAHSYEILDCLKTKTAVAQFHPLASLTGDRPIPAGSLCAISSHDESAIKTLHQLAQQMGLIPVTLDPKKAVEYHAAAVLTGNLSLGLVQQSINLMETAGIDSTSARLGLARLLRSTADNLEEQEIHEALTGPLARGDTQTIEKHLSVLNPEVSHVYQILCHWLSTQKR